MIKCNSCGWEGKEDPYIGWRRWLKEVFPDLGYIMRSKCPVCGTVLALEVKGIKKSR
jgi:rRNA maturation protein Nop10